MEKKNVKKKGRFTKESGEITKGYVQTFVLRLLLENKSRGMPDIFITIVFVDYQDVSSAGETQEYRYTRLG